jgi:Na+/H+ antiporter NhaD/arsenite permease-like protein
MAVLLSVTPTEPGWPIMLPFAVLLLAIAVGPVVAQRHWERHYHRLCILLAAIVVGYYLCIVRDNSAVLHALKDYAGFMAVVGSSFIVSGGIHFQVRAPSGPIKNTVFLGFGTMLATLIGTIAASTLLIRPWIAMNKGRIAPIHIAFFIFLVSNVGGGLLPTGPPLILGYLKGVPFGWTLLHCWPAWLLTVAILLLIFFVCDTVNHRGLPETRGEADLTSWKCEGARNLMFLFVILAALIALPAGWREIVLVVTALGSFLTTPSRIRKIHNFSFEPLTEVAWLFLGIFGTMIPVLQFMEQSAEKLALHTGARFFWATGLLSALLDNAPTYLAFFATALGVHHLDINESADIAAYLSRSGGELVAISLGAAFFGALSYIGNAPNLLVKTMAEHSGARTPTFLDYIWKFALPVMVPVLGLISFLFFRP